MENNDDRSIETTTLVKRKFISFPLAYWSAAIVIIISIDYNDGVKRLSHYDFTEGIVVDKIMLRPPGGSRNSGDVEYAQWQYKTDQGDFLFVDKQNDVYYLPIGTKRKIIYRKDKHDEAHVYRPMFWVNTPMIIVSMLIATFIFAIIQFAIHWKDKLWFDRWGQRY